MAYYSIGEVANGDAAIDPAFDFLNPLNVLLVKLAVSTLASLRL